MRFRALVGQITCSLILILLRSTRTSTDVIILEGVKFSGMGEGKEDEVGKSRINVLRRVRWQMEVLRKAWGMSLAE